MTKKKDPAPDHRIIVFPSSDGQTTLQTPTNTKKIRHIRGLRRFWIEQTLGFNDSLHCWCGASLEINYIVGNTIDTDSMTARLRHFNDEHAECPAPSPSPEGEAQ